MSSDFEQISFLSLRKTPYSESSLVVAGISPERGQVHFLVKGGRKVSKKGGVPVDVFRIFEVTYRASKSDLKLWQAASLIEDLGGIAKSSQSMWVAGWLGRFALMNVAEGVPCPAFFRAIRQALYRLCVAIDLDEDTRQILFRTAEVGPLLVFLQEHGLLSAESTGSGLDKTTDLQKLLDMAEGKRGIPRLAPEDWDRLREWCVSLLKYGDYRVP